MTKSSDLLNWLKLLFPVFLVIAVLIAAEGDSPAAIPHKSAFNLSRAEKLFGLSEMRLQRW
jgi:hypothetical protein